MGFYYFSILSFMLAGVVSAIVIAILLAIWFWRKLPKGWLYVLIPAVIIAPWSEELWIAYHFGQLCRKDAGLFINKTVEADGYYYDTGTPVTRLPPGSPYQFIESPDDKGKFRRVDRASPEEKERTLKWYAEEYRGKRFEKGKNEWIKHAVSDRTQVIVEIDTGYAWRINMLDKPTARYHYTRDSYGVPVAHKVFRQEARVTDTTSGEILGRHVAYGRRAYWFFIHLSAPKMGCDGPEGGPDTKHSSLIYEQILKPIR